MTNGDERTEIRTEQESARGKARRRQAREREERVLTLEQQPHIRLVVRPCEGQVLLEDASGGRRGFGRDGRDLGDRRGSGWRRRWRCDVGGKRVHRGDVKIYDGSILGAALYYSIACIGTDLCGAALYSTSVDRIWIKHPPFS
jgi:hypothetical protein